MTLKELKKRSDADPAFNDLWFAIVEAFDAWLNAAPEERAVLGDFLEAANTLRGEEGEEKEECIKVFTERMNRNAKLRAVVERFLSLGKKARALNCTDMILDLIRYPWASINMEEVGDIDFCSRVSA